MTVRFLGKRAHHHNQQTRCHSQPTTGCGLEEFSQSLNSHKESADYNRDHPSPQNARYAVSSQTWRQPNIVFIFADQMRAQATGYAGNSYVRTPSLDRLAAEGIEFTNAVPCCPVCTPYRASLLTGRYPLSTGLFINDLRLPEEELSVAQVLRDQGYDTGYIGKWHLDGPERSGYTPPGPRRQGFDFWAVGNCTHNYHHSLYYRDTPEPLYWEGYDAHAQTELAIEYIHDHGRERPYCLFLSWGPPHNPYRDVPQDYLDLYEPATVPVRPNCPAPDREALAGYYAQVTALDEDVGRIMVALEETGQAENTILVFTSDHGDMIGSHGVWRKQWPWDECVLVPLLVRYPVRQGSPRQEPAPISVVDLMPTLLSLAGAPVPDVVEGTDLSHLLSGQPGPRPNSALILSVAPFGECPDAPEWRGVRTEQHTYVRTLQGPWLLYDNHADPYQMHNLVDDPQYADLRETLDRELGMWLDRTGDEFLPAQAYRDRWGYVVDEQKAIPYTN